MLSPIGCYYCLFGVAMIELLKEAMAGDGGPTLNKVLDDFLMHHGQRYFTIAELVAFVRLRHEDPEPAHVVVQALLNLDRVEEVGDSWYQAYAHEPYERPSGLMRLVFVSIAVVIVAGAGYILYGLLEPFWTHIGYVLVGLFIAGIGLGVAKTKGQNAQRGGS